MWCKRVYGYGVGVGCGAEGGAEWEFESECECEWVDIGVDFGHGWIGGGGWDGGFVKTLRGYECLGWVV